MASLALLKNTFLRIRHSHFMKKMVVLNFFPVSIGGGLQNSLSFLKCLSAEKSAVDFDYIISCRVGSAIQAAAMNYDLPHVAYRGGVIGRLWYELWLARKLCDKVDAKCVFSLFGNAPFTVSSEIIKISGFAYSNIIHDDVDFWGWLPRSKRIMKVITDALRLFLARRSSIIILETDYLYLRAKSGIFNDKDLRIVQMAPSSLVVSALSEKVSGVAHSGTQIPDVIRVLYLSGAHPNKRIHLLAPLFFELSKKSLTYKLITTLPQGDYLKAIVDAFAEYGISKCHENIGPVAPSDVAATLRASQAIINVAMLESFSNNWVEAWAAGLPLLVTDADWARASCDSAAIYVDINHPAESSQQIHSFFSSEEKYAKLISNGKLMLSSLPSAEERTRQYLEIIRSSLRD